MPAALEAVVLRDCWSAPRRTLRPLGLLGLFLACATMLAAVAVGLASLVALPLASAALLTAAWPALFSAEFTRWVFGADAIPFWKAFVLALAASTAFKALRGGSSWQRR